MPTTNLKFGSCTSSSPMIEASKLVTIKVESQSQTPSLRSIEAPALMWLSDCVYYIDDPLPHAPLELS